MFRSVSKNLVGTLNDTLTVKYGKKHGTEFGQARLYGAVSWALMSIVIGYLAEMTGSWAIATIPAALLGALLTVMTGRALLLETEEDRNTDYARVIEEDTEDSTITKNDEQGDSVTPLGALRKFTATAFSTVFLLSLFALSTGTSIVEFLSFEYFTSQLQASPSLNGWTVLVTVIFEVPIFHYAGTLERRIGYIKMLMISMLSYSTRVIGYTLVPEAWMILLLEPLHGVTYALGKTASISFVRLK